MYIRLRVGVNVSEAESGGTHGYARVTGEGGGWVTSSMTIAVSTAAMAPISIPTIPTPMPAGEERGEEGTRGGEEREEKGRGSEGEYVDRVGLEQSTLTGSVEHCAVLRERAFLLLRLWLWLWLWLLLW